MRQKETLIVEARASITQDPSGAVFTAPPGMSNIHGYRGTSTETEKNTSRPQERANCNLGEPKVTMSLAESEAFMRMMTTGIKPIEIGEGNRKVALPLFMWQPLGNL